MDWVKLAQELPLGRSRRVHCWHCHRKDPTLSITNRGKNYTYHCFGCKEAGVADPPPMTPHERRELVRAAEAFEQSEPCLPDDFTTDIPVAGLLWLSKGGLHIEDITEHGFGWSGKLQRVVMPVMRKGKLVAVQARSVSQLRPKYLSQVTSGSRPVFKAGRCYGQKRITLTEDILSASRVGKVLQAWALLGTNLMPSVIRQLAEEKTEVIYVWMDDDEAGINARRKILKQLGAVGLNAIPIISDRDPKHHTLQEIKELHYESIKQS